MTLPEEECAFFYAALAQLAPTCARFSPSASGGSWAPIQTPAPATSIVRFGRRWSGCGRHRRASSCSRTGRWNSNAPAFERISKGAA